MTGFHQGKTVIIGAAETYSVGIQPDISELELSAQASWRALDDAGLAPEDVDGVAGMAPPFEIADHLGITARWLDGTNVGGTSYLLHVRHAAAAIAAGAANVVLVTHGESGRSHNGSAGFPHTAQSIAGQFEFPFGATAPYSTFTVPALAYLQKFGLGQQELAEVVVAQREWAVPNTRAFRRTPVTVGEVMAAPPLRGRSPATCAVS